jgi:hypothetical protein
VRFLPEVREFITRHTVSSATLPTVLDSSGKRRARLGEQVGAGMVEATEEVTIWNSDAWISDWALAGKGDTAWCRAWRPAKSVASQAKILGPVGNEHVEIEHTGGLTALRLRELRRKEILDRQERVFAAEAAARILRSTFLAEGRIRPFSFGTSERAQYLIEAIDELETESRNLAGQVLRLEGYAKLVKPCQGLHGGEGFWVKLGEPARSGDDSPEGGEESSTTLVQRRRASCTRPQDCIHGLVGTECMDWSR